MSAVLTFLTSRKTTLVAFLMGLVLFFADASVVSTLHDLGIGDVVIAKLTAFAKILSMGLAALGYSPLKRPDPPAGSDTP